MPIYFAAGRMAVLCLLILGVSSQSAVAVEIPITARFEPSILDPTRNAFVNTTPQSGYCAQYPAYCSPGEVSLATGITITERLLEGDQEDHRQWHFAAIDASWRTVDVTGPDGLAHTVRFRLNLVSQRQRKGPDGSQPGGGGAAVGGCRGRLGFSTSSWYHYGWQLPEGRSYCWRRPNPYPIPGVGFTVDSIAVGYSLETPNPLAMKNGIYTGVIRYTVGEGGDFDIGYGTYSDNEISFNLTLTVAHEFSVVLPAGSEKVALQPVGGWSTWLEQGRKPTRLQQEAPFQLTSSGRFGVRLACEHTLGERCAIRSDRDSAEAPLDISITMPGMFDVSTGAPAVDAALTLLNPAPRFGSVEYVENRPSRLRFSVSGAPLSEMLSQGGSVWRGGVTVIFDADP